MLQIKNYRKAYGAVTVLDINDLFIAPGIYWIKGVNGSGKSTLLKSAAGIIDFEGDLFLDKNISLKKNAVAYRRLVNFAEAEPVFPEFLTGTEMIRLFSQAKDAPIGQENEYLSSMKMNQWIGEPLGTYSSGMLKKLSIVLAFIGNPKLILLDEPLITIDTDSLSVLYQWIADKHRGGGSSFLLSSHQALSTDLFSAKEIAVEFQTARLNA